MAADIDAGALRVVETLAPGWLPSPASRWLCARLGVGTRAQGLGCGYGCRARRSGRALRAHGGSRRAVWRLGSDARRGRLRGGPLPAAIARTAMAAVPPPLSWPTPAPMPSAATLPSTACSTTRENGAILDYVDGQRDLHAGIIRAIGDPTARFAEDDLRLLRAVRFAARLGFTIEPADVGRALRSGRVHCRCQCRAPPR